MSSIRASPAPSRQPHRQFHVIIPWLVSRQFHSLGAAIFRHQSRTMTEYLGMQCENSPLGAQVSSAEHSCFRSVEQGQKCSWPDCGGIDKEFWDSPAGFPLDKRPPGPPSTSWISRRSAAAALWASALVIGTELFAAVPQRASSVEGVRRYAPHPVPLALQRP